MKPPSESSTEGLQDQLSTLRFEHALEIASDLGTTKRFLTTAELARINRVITGQDKVRSLQGEPPSPWREEPLTVPIPGGKTAKFSVLSDPEKATRDQIHNAIETAGLADEKSRIDIGIDLYISLVKLHVFIDGNRRTAVAAAHYFFARYGCAVTGRVLHDIGLGDVRDDSAVTQLRETVHQLSRFMKKK